MADLKPCPFCGGEAKMEAWRDSHLMRKNPTLIYCSVCLAENKIYECQQEAIEAWNRRADNG